MIIISAVRVLLKGSLVWFIWKNTNLKKRLVPLKYVREYLQYCRNWPFTSFCVRTMKVLALKENSLFPWTGQSSRSLSMSPKYRRLFFLSYIHTCIWKPKGAHTRRASTHTHNNSVPGLSFTCLSFHMAQGQAAHLLGWLTDATSVTGREGSCW